MIVDAHVHFWDPSALAYPWLAAAPALRQAFLPSHYTAAAAGAGVDRLVFVEANATPDQNVREIQFVERLAASGACIAAIVANVELTYGESLEQTLDCASAHPRVKGLRQNIQGRPCGFALQDAFIEGVRRAGRRGYTFDICVTCDQLPEAIALVERCPETRFVLDHCGKPTIRATDDARWRRDIERLAHFDNVWCKISGLFTEMAADATHEDLLRYARHAVDCFGATRVMYGSDWPVLTLRGTYATWLEVTRKLTNDWTADDTRRFYADNALEFYGI